MSDSPNKLTPRARATNAARVLGWLITVVASLILLVSLFTLTRVAAGPAVAILIAVMLFYLAPGIALLLLSGPMKRGSKGATIAVLVIACVIAVFLGLGVLIQIVSAVAGGLSTSALVPLAFMAIIAIVAGLLAVYCIQTLRFPDELNVQRGFELLVTPMPVAPRADESKAG